MPEVTCPCGKKFGAARANAKYCSDRCRKRTKRSGADVVSLPAPAEEPKPAANLGPITEQVLVELGNAERLQTTLGLTALALASRLDNGGFETGSAYASLVKAFKETMAEATRGAGKATAPQALADELAARRERQGA